MRRLLSAGFMGALIIVTSGGCVIPSEEAASPPAQVHAADARALAYGRTVGEVLQNPEIKDKIRALFGADWAPAAEGRTTVPQGAAAYFQKSRPLRMVRIGEADYIAIDGCVPSACQTKRGLLLIQEGGAQLLAGLDDGGLSHYYAYGGSVKADAIQPIVDGARTALQGLDNP
jgi:hypothetical protein